MLTVTVKNSDDGVVLQCQGRIVRGDETAILCAAVRQERRNVTLDLTEWMPSMPQESALWFRCRLPVSISRC